jgi:amyloid beta precursor protein binding protein 1
MFFSLSSTLLLKGYAIFYSFRAPNADLPNTAAFLGGLVAQEIIKMITHQYIPIKGFCVIDLVESWTGLL